MKIRSITCFFNPALETIEKAIQKRSKFIEKALETYKQNGYEVQTVRLATTPFTHWLPLENPNQSIRQVVEMEKTALASGFSYLALGPALPQNMASYDMIPLLIKETQQCFFGGLMGTAADGIYLDAVKACAKVIFNCAPITSDGFANLRFSAFSNLPPYGPFFPSSYAGGNEPAFALAIESADEAVAAFENTRDLSGCRQALLTRLENHSRVIEKEAKHLAEGHQMVFKGIDISLAPYPEDYCSMGKAIELLGPANAGLNGSLAAAAFIADTLDLGQWQKVGFNGLMLPVLEDSVLAQRSINGTLTVRDLLLFSAVCGAGLDTVPLPGDVSIEQLAAVLMDVAALANRLGKPLTARLMPVPGKKAGEKTGFDFSFFANGAAMDLPARPLVGPLAGSGQIKFTPRKPAI